MWPSCLDASANAPWLDFACVPSLVRLRMASSRHKAGVHQSLVCGLAAMCSPATPEQRCRVALRVLATMADHANEVVVGAAASVLRHSDHRPRKAALETLGRLCCRGDAAVLSAVLECLLHDSSVEVRRKSVDCLCRLLDKDDKATTSALVTAVVQLLEDVNLPMRKTALYALQHLDVRGDTPVVEAVIHRLGHPQAYVRNAAFNAIKYVLDRGDKATIAKMVDRLDHPSSHVRSAMAAALGALVNVEDKDVVAALGERLHDDEPEVRNAALVALGGLSENGCVLATEIVTASPELGRLAVGALARFAREVRASRCASWWAAIDGGRDIWQSASSDLSVSLQRPFLRCREPRLPPEGGCGDCSPPCN